MEEIKSNTSFWEEISAYKILVPYYQRDYAQGRKDGGRIDNIREVFVEELLQALTNGKTCHLGLVFGSYDDNNKTFIAVDGQQRLTTVFLLHWYIAWKENVLDKYDEVLKNFSWDTRSYSSQFIDLLFRLDNNTGKDVQSIKMNSDYFSIWENDPTVKGMLTMLEEIESQYQKCKRSLSNYLFCSDCNIKYDILKLSKESDARTYLKMNSRGRSLTTYELFKSKFINYFKIDFSRKFDREWLNFMLNRSKTSEGKYLDPDIPFMNYINEYAYFLSYNGNANNIEDPKKFIDAKIKDNSLDVPFISFSKYIPVFDNNIEKFKKDFDWLTENYDTIKKVDDSIRFDNSRFFIDAIIVDKDPNFSHRVKLCALFKYAELTNYDVLDHTLYTRWSRVFRNLIANSDIDASNIKSLAASINKINNSDIYQYLKNDGEIGTFEQKRVTEEISKVKQIIDDKGLLRKYDGSIVHDGSIKFNTWEEIIADAEMYAFFRGAICFLFVNEQGVPYWSSFDKKYIHAKAYFDKKGVKIEYREGAKFLRHYISMFDKWEQFWQFKYDYEPDTWKKLLLSDRFAANEHLFTGTIKNDNFESSLLKSYKMSTSPADKQKALAIHYLVNSTILVEASKFHSVLNARYNIYSLYPYNTKASWKVYVIGSIRNELLSILNDKKIVAIKGDKRFASGDCNRFFWDWDVDFTYRGKNFRWYRNDYIYLMGDKDPSEWMKRDETKNLDLEVYFCFDASQNPEIESFKGELDKLIEEWNSK